MRKSETVENTKNKASNGVKGLTPYKPAARSRVTNGRSLLSRQVDGRSLWVRRFRDIQALLISDLGGSDQISTAELAIVRRAATLMVELELREEQFATSEPDYHKLEQYSRVAGNMRRLLESLGLQRRPRDVTPDLRQYLDAKVEAAE